MSEIQTTDWDSTAANNNQTPPNGWPEGQAPSTVNDCARELMAAVKRWFTRVMGLTDAGALVSSAGTSTAITVTYDVAPASLYTGLECGFKVTTTCGADPTLNVNALGAKNIQKFRGGYVNLQAGDILANQHVKVKYDGTLDKWLLIGDSPRGVELISVQTASASSSIDFVLTDYLSTYRAFRFELTGVNPATDAVHLYVRTSTNAGSSYDAGASDYSWVYWGRTDAAADFNTSDAADNEIEIANSIGNGAAEDLDGEVTLFNPVGTTFHKKVEFNATYVAASGALSITKGSGRRAATADVDAIRFVMSSGNIAAGTFALYGIK